MKQKNPPINAQEAKDQAIFFLCIDTMDDILLHDNPIYHITISAIVVKDAHDKVLFAHHNISWAWLNGHTDGDSNLLFVTQNEIEEETGVKVTKPLTHDICSLDDIPVMAHTKMANMSHPIYTCTTPICLKQPASYRCA